MGEYEEICFHCPRVYTWVAANSLYTQVTATQWERKKPAPNISLSRVMDGCSPAKSQIRLDFKGTRTYA
jgi:hypothetical protein